MLDITSASNVAEAYRASPQQRHVWRLRSLRPRQTASADATSERRGEPVYVVRWTVDIHGALEPWRLEAALDWLTRRLEICRTDVRCPPGLTEPLQYVAERAPVVRRGRHIAFVGGSLEAEVVDNPAGGRQLEIEMPAECADLYTPELLTRELANAYGRPHEESDEQPVQFVELAAMLNEIAQSDTTGVGLTYWHRQLPAQALPWGLTRAVAGTPFRPERIPVQLNVDTDAALAAGDPTVTETALLSCWVAFLTRVWNERGITVAIARNARTHEELASIPGPLAWMLPFRIDTAPGDSLQHLRDRVTVALDAGIEWLHCFDWERVGGHAALVNALPLVAFQYLHYGSTFVADRTQFRVSGVRAVTECPALLLTAAHTQAACQLELQYDSSVVRREIALQLAEGYARLAVALFTNPNECILDFPCLSAREETLVLRAANQTAVSWGDEASLHGLVEAQAERTPDAIAIVSESLHVTYQSLRGLAERSAARLRAEGVGPDDRVGLMLRPSVALVSEMLGILKAGGAYVPIDPSYPVERRRFMIRHARMKILLTDASCGIDATEPSVKILGVENAVSTPIRRECHRNGRHHPELAAYIIYTSGSTGQPKGVVVPHRAIVNHMRWMARQFPLSCNDAVLQKTPFSFDASVWEFWAPLMAGARLVLARPDGFRDIPYVVRQLIEERITVLQGVPSWLRLLVDNQGLHLWTTARAVFAGGEPLDSSLASALASRTGAEVWNLYGPTETAIDSTFECFDEFVSTSRVPIGGPVANSVAYVLDEGGWQAPRGTVGELHIGGDCLARGYLGRPDLTAERFVPDAFGDQPGGRVYRTGDLARRRLDLRLECLGRADRQVKLRGFRVELGELEMALVACAGVRAAAAKVTGGQDDQRLLAFVEADAGGCDEVSIRRQMTATTPAYMIPDRLVIVSHLARLPNGKIDYAALTEPPLPTTARLGPAPRNGIEARLASVWCDVLKVDQVATDVNFFEMGGNSLLLIQAHQRLKQVCNENFSVVDLFHYPTIRAFAAYLESVASRRQPLKD